MEKNTKKNLCSARFGSTYTKIGTIQRRLAWPLRKDDTQIREAFHIFKQIGGKAQKVDSDSSKPPETLTDPPGVCQEKVEEKPPPAPTIATKPIRTGPIKPQAIKTEETKS